MSSVLFENLAPHVLRATQYLRREGSQLLLFLRKLTLTFRHLGVSAHRLLGSLDACLQGIASREIGNGHCDDHTTDTQTGLFTCGHTTAVFHIRTLTSSV